MRPFSFRRSLTRTFLALSLPLCFFPQAQAIEVIDPDNHPAEPEPPTHPANFPIDHLISFNSDRSAIYLGDLANNGTYWLLTAAHNPAPASVTIGSNSYDVLRSVFLSNSFPLNPSLNISGTPDLQLVQIDASSAPMGLGNLHIASSAPSTSDLIYLLGNGTGGEIWAVAPVSSAVSGFNPYGVIDVSGYRTHGYVTLINTSDPMAPGYYGYGLPGDSGGGGLIYDSVSGQWLLSGTLIARTGDEYAPIRGTYLGLLNVYRDQIYAAVPEPGTYALMGIAGAAMMLWRRKRSASLL